MSFYIIFVAYAGCGITAYTTERPAIVSQPSINLSRSPACFASALQSVKRLNSSVSARQASSRVGRRCCSVRSRAAGNHRVCCRLSKQSLFSASDVTGHSVSIGFIGNFISFQSATFEAIEHVLLARRVAVDCSLCDSLRDFDVADVSRRDCAREFTDVVRWHQTLTSRLLVLYNNVSVVRVFHGLSSTSDDCFGCCGNGGYSNERSSMEYRIRIRYGRQLSC
jgi:hypothetical protein